MDPHHALQQQPLRSPHPTRGATAIAARPSATAGAEPAPPSGMKMTMATKITQHEVAALDVGARHVLHDDDRTRPARAASQYHQEVTISNLGRADERHGLG